MSFDQNALDSLRIERNNEPDPGSGKPYKWFLIVVIALAVIAAGWVLLRDDAIKVQTATAVAATTGTGTGPSVLNASGYVVARRQHPGLPTGEALRRLAREDIATFAKTTIGRITTSVVTTTMP